MTYNIYLVVILVTPAHREDVRVNANGTRFEKLLEAVPDALVGMDQEGVIRFVNTQTELLFGFDRDQLIGENIDLLVPETLWQIYVEHREGYFADPRTRSSGVDVKLSARHHNGDYFQINIGMSHIDTGHVLLVITAAGDVAQQEQAVQDAGLTTAIVEYSDDAIIGSTLDGTITSWNPAAEKLYGYSGGEILGRSLGLLTPKDQAGETKAVLAKIRAGEDVVHLETFRRRKDGAVIRVSLTVSPIRDLYLRVIAASAVHRDASTLSQALQTARLAISIIDNSDDAIVSVTLDGIITSWNPGAQRMFGYSSEEVVGRSAEALVPADRKEESADCEARLSAGQSVRHLDTIRVRRDGTALPVSMTAFPIRDPDGTIVGFSAIFRDVTVRGESVATA